MTMPAGWTDDGTISPRRPVFAAAETTYRSGRYRIDKQRGTRTCVDCGALVGDAQAHDNWHEGGA